MARSSIPRSPWYTGSYYYNKVPKWAFQGEWKHIDFTKSLAAIPVGSTTNTGWSNARQDATLAGIDGDEVANPICLNATKIGDSFYQREGRRIAVWGLHIHARIRMPSDQYNIFPDEAEEYRIVVYVDKRPSGVAVGADSLMRGIGGQASCINFFQNVSNIGRFKVLYDKIGTLQNPTVGVFGTSLATMVQTGLGKLLRINIKFKKPLIVTYNTGNSGTYTDIEENSIFIAIVRANGNVEPGLELEYYGRMKFKG